MTVLTDLVARFLDELFVLQPDVATSVGDHRFDDRWPDTSEAGRQVRLAFADRWTAAFEGLGLLDLNADERIDRDLVLGELAGLRFGEADLREDTWDPLAWVCLLGMGLLPLTTREFAPLHVRLASVAGRLEGIPRIIADAQARLGSGPRPVSRLHAEVASRRIAGVADLGRGAVEAAEAAAPGDPAVAAPSCPACGPPPRRPNPSSRPSAGISPPTWFPPPPATPPWGTTCSPPSCATPSRTPPSPRRPSLPGPRRSSRPCAPRWSASRARSGGSGVPASPSRTTTAPSSVAPSTPSPRIT